MQRGARLRLSVDIYTSLNQQPAAQINNINLYLSSIFQNIISTKCLNRIKNEKLKQSEEQNLYKTHCRIKTIFINARLSR